MGNIRASFALIHWFIWASDSLVWSYSMAVLYISAIACLGWIVGSQMHNYKLVRCNA